MSNQVDDPYKPLIDDQVRALALELAPRFDEFKSLQELGREKLGGVFTGGGGKIWYTVGQEEFLYDIGFMELFGIQADNGMHAAELFGTSAGFLTAAATSRANGNKAKFQEAFFFIKRNEDIYKNNLGGWSTAGNITTVLTNGPALLDNSPLEKKMIDLFGKQRFDDLPIPARATAFVVADDNPTKLTHKIITLKKDDFIVDAAMATTAMPLIFKKRKYKGMLLSDGGTGANCPIIYAYQNNCTRIIVLYCSPDSQNNAVSKIKGCKDEAMDLPQAWLDQFEDNSHKMAEMYQDLLIAQGKRPAAVLTSEPFFDTGTPVEFAANRWLRERGYRDAKKKFTEEVILTMLFGPGGIVSL